MTDLLQTEKFKCSVSSVLNKNVKQNGKQYMYDTEEDTAWSSNEGTPQWINIQFEELQAMHEFEFQFQGGFAGKHGIMTAESADGNKLCEETFYPDDVNSVQKFKLKNPILNKEVLKIKFLFASSTDFFGRIIVYKLKVF
ncbi:nuclear receptor 2C2-associated protein [Teleopsis dalmanni]|uniref:nuclear receptor 2C2-associated protein n=1 Tax=Teleopsis dalmanni TaxID=139649 RepID=UPI0018CDC4E6|nr:nuclear receptor 2C2-associated protein [Teleopsis dalmanni]